MQFYQDDRSPRVTKREMRKSIIATGSSANVRRLARWLRVRHIDDMSDRQLIRFLDWLFKRREKRERGMIPLW